MITFCANYGWDKTLHFSTGLYSVNVNIDVEKLKPVKKYNELHCNDNRKIIEYEGVCLNCIGTINDYEEAGNAADDEIIPALESDNST